VVQHRPNGGRLADSLQHGKLPGAMPTRHLIALCLALLFTVPVAIAQEAGPESKPPRRLLIVPPDFKIVAVDRRRAICQEGDEPWVRQALTDATPATLPSTMPVTLLERASEQRDVLCERIASDLGLPDASGPRKMFDENLLPVLRQSAAFDPPIYYMVSTEPVVRRIVKQGWENPLFYLNRAADRIAINQSVNMSLSADSDDILLPALYEPEHDMPTRRRVLLDSIATAEQKLAYELSIQSEFAVQMAFVGFIGQNGFNPIELSDSQEWFALGTTAVLSAQYLSAINGMNEQSYLQRMTTDEPRNPIRMATVNLLNPMTSDDLRPQFQGAYLDAYRRRATSVVYQLMQRAPRGSLAKAINAIKDQRPADGVAMVKLIAEQTGIDLTN